MNTWTRKLSSRKLWIAVIGIIVGLATAFGIDESEWTPVVGVIGSIASCVAYILGEAKIDAAHKDPAPTETVTGETSIIGTMDPDIGTDAE